MKKEVAILIIMFLLGLFMWSKSGKALEEMVGRFCNVDIFPVVIYENKKQCPYGNSVLVGVDWHKEQIACGRISVSCNK